MAEKQVMEQVSQPLILQTVREKLLSKLQYMESNNLTERQQKHLRIFIGHFISLSYSFFGLSKTQLREFNEVEIKELVELISRKARPWAICQMLFTFGVPLIGWIIGLGPGLAEGEWHSFLYLYHKNYLKGYKKDYFPFDMLKKELLK